MIAIHDHFTHQLRNSLEATVKGLGLVRLLQDVGRAAEARSTLYSLENGFQRDLDKSDRPNRKPHRANRLRSVIRKAPCSSGAA